MITDGYIDHRILPDGRLVGVFLLTFGRARLAITDDDTGFSYSDAW